MSEDRQFPRSLVEEVFDQLRAVCLMTVLEYGRDRWVIPRVSRDYHRHTGKLRAPDGVRRGVPYDDQDADLRYGMGRVG